MKRIRKYLLLRKANALDLVPVQRVQSIPFGNNTVRLLVPRFNTKWLERVMALRNKSAYFHVNLDAMGTQVWLLMNGVLTSGQIVKTLEEKSTASGVELEEATTRVLAFIADMYRKDLITFKQLEKYG